jgi:kynurenine 3-monooxygenase
MSKIADSVSRMQVVGSGLVGSFLSLALARRGYSVEVFERRPDLRKEKISAGRSINLALSTRGIHALSRMGLEIKVLDSAVAMKGRMMHAVDGTLTYQAYGKTDEECIYSISRGGLNQLLLEAAEKTGKVQQHFRHKAVDADLDSGWVEYLDEASGQRVRCEAEVVFGTDGSASLLRQRASERSGFSVTNELLEAGYKEFHIPPSHTGAHLMEKHALHIWPRGRFMLIALPNFDGSFTCTLFLDWKGETSFEALEKGGTEAVVSFFSRYFPDVLPLLQDVPGTWAVNPTGQLITIRCAPWNIGARTLLLGDAAHAIVPFYGQGMNCGFEDCAILDDLIGADPSGWQQRLGEYAVNRKPDADAIADLALWNFVEMRDKVGDARFLLEKGIEKLLLQKWPDRFGSRYALTTFSRVPYRVADQVGKIADTILADLSEGLSRPEEVDFARAEKLIEERLAPIWPGPRS